LLRKLKPTPEWREVIDVGVRRNDDDPPPHTETRHVALNGNSSSADASRASSEADCGFWPCGRESVNYFFGNKVHRLLLK
jgi:hypothetical protein